MKFFRRKAPATLLFIAGEGGHLEQARRILRALEPDVRSGCKCILISDADSGVNCPFDACWVVDTCAPKHRSSQLRDLMAYGLSSVKTVWRMLRHHDVRMVIVTGPGFSVIPALSAKAFGAYLMVFESWSRFEHRSKCGKALYRFSDQFMVQHKQLLALYPKAKWVGLL